MRMGTVICRAISEAVTTLRIASTGQSFDGHAHANARVAPCAVGSVLLAGSTHSAHPQVPGPSGSCSVTSDKTAADDSISLSNHAAFTTAACTLAAGHAAVLACSTSAFGMFIMPSTGSSSALRGGPFPLRKALFSERVRRSNCCVQKPPDLMKRVLISDKYAGAERYWPLLSSAAAISNRRGVISRGCQFLARQRRSHQVHLASTDGVVVAASSLAHTSFTASSSLSTSSSPSSDPLA